MTATAAEQIAEESPIAKAVRLVGGIHACARLTGVAPSTVFHRIRVGHMPMTDAMKLELKTGVRVEEMIPSDQFDEWFSYRMSLLVKSASSAKAAA